MVITIAILSLVPPRNPLVEHMHHAEELSLLHLRMSEGGTFFMQASCCAIMSLDNLRIDVSSGHIPHITTLSPSVPEVGRLGCSVRILLGLVKPRCTCWEHASTSLTN